MHITVKGKQIDVGEALRRHVEQALAATVEKFFSNPLDSQVVISREAHLFRADVTVHVGRGILVQGHATGQDAYPAADGAIEHVARRLSRYKTRLRDHHKQDGAEPEPAQSYVLAAEPDDHDGSEPVAAAQPVVIAEMTTHIATLSVGEAVMRLDLGDLPALMFRHAGHGGLNVVYRRQDGNIGWIDPQGNAALSGKRSARRTA